jgi:hypothetical protein
VTLEELAAVSGVPMVTLSRAERGERPLAERHEAARQRALEIVEAARTIDFDVDLRAAKAWNDPKEAAAFARDLAERLRRGGLEALGALTVFETLSATTRALIVDALRAEEASS